MVDILGGHALDLFTYILGHISSLTVVAKNQVRACTITDLDVNTTGEVIPQSKPTQYCVAGVLESGAPFCVHFQAGVPETEFRLICQAWFPVEENRSGLLWEAVAEGKESYATLEDAVRIQEVLVLQSEEGRRVDL
ncbi:hypothetical protein D9757_010741 [Collybiopsis confluens]|uniref:Gal80p-like C-terminal domain-containing protein n=1 Tax=Collybiopsis confluens TaxID=2823264 RepID=A0A8H5LYB5_9AGAR|nr:hypothetical protein D9757_010741 [Collybiopsis confluens]